MLPYIACHDQLNLLQQEAKKKNLFSIKLLSVKYFIRGMRKVTNVEVEFVYVHDFYKEAKKKKKKSGRPSDSGL